MPKIKRKKADGNLLVKEFDGLRDDAESAQSGALYIRNFQFSPERTLEKRPGFRQKLDFNQPIRTFWHSTVLTLPGDFVLLGSQILYCPENGTPVSFGNVVSTQGAAKFFVYHDYLYLAASCSLYVCNLEQRRFSAACGYAPLYGEDWNPSLGSGSVLEPLNLLSPHLRVRYLCPMGTQIIRLPFPGVSVESVTQDGVAIPFSFNSDSLSVTLSYALPSTTRVEVAYTMTSDWTPLRDSIGHCTLPYAFRKDDKEYLYLSGGQIGFKVYSASQVNDEQFTASRARFADSDPLYFKASGVLYLGDQTHPVTAFARQNNRVIAFGTSGAWSIWRGNTSDVVEAYPLESCPGCVSREGAFAVGDELIVLTSSGLCALRANYADKDLFSIELLTAKIAKILGPFDWAHALILYDPIKNRLLIRDPGESDEGLVYLYDRTLKSWTCWDGIHASAFFASPEGNVIFQCENEIFAFDEALHTDAGTRYDCTYKSAPLSFDSPEEWKRSLRAFCEVSAESGEEFGIELYSEHDEIDALWTCEEGDFPSHFECRLPSGRFRNFYYCLFARGEGQIKIHRLGCCCNL